LREVEAKRARSTVLRLRPRLTAMSVSALLLASVSACGSDEPLASSNTGPSSRYDGRGYSIDVPADWSTHESQGPWPPSTRPDPYVAGFDTFIDASDMVVIGQREVGGGTGLDAWQRSLRREGSLRYDECGTLGEPAPSSLGNAPAESRTFSCAAHGVEAELVFAVHGTTGWVLMCTVPLGGELPVQDACEKRIESFRFSS
jgi:hypothetical protein